MSVNLNGDLSQWTLGTEFLSCAHAQMVADGFRYCDTTSAVHHVRRSTDVPGIMDCGRVIPYSLEVEVATAAAPGATENSGIVYRGEGSEWAGVHKRATAPRLWVKTSVPGLYHFGLANGPENLCAPMPVEIGVSDVWTPVQVNIPAAPGEWYLDHRVGYSMFFFLASGTGFHSRAGQWIEGAKCGTEQVNFNATVGNKIKLAGFRLRESDDASPDEFEFPELVERSCMRYLEKSFARAQKPASGLGWGNGEKTWKALSAGAGVHSATERFLVPKRKAPTISGFNPLTGGSQAQALSAGTCSGTAFDEITEFGFRVSTTTPVGTAANETLGAQWVADATLPAPGGGSGA